MFNFGNALSNFKSSIKPTVDKARSSIASIFPKTPEQTREFLKNPVVNLAEPVINKTFGTIKKGTDAVIGGIDKFDTSRKEAQQKAVEDTPDFYKPMAKFGNAVGNIPYGLTKFGADMITQTVRDSAYTGEMLTSQTGRDELVTSAINLPQIIKEEGFLSSLDEPAMIALFVVPDFFTGGGKATLGREAAEVVAKGALKKTERELAEKVLKQVADEPGFWNKVLTSEGLENFLNGSIVGSVKDFLSKGETIIKKVPGGEQMMKLITKTHDEAEIMMAKVTKSIRPTLKNLTDDEFMQALDVQRGVLKSTNKKINEGAKVLDNMFTEYRTLAEELGMKVKTATGKTRPFVALENYVPQKLNIEALKKDPALQEALAKYLYETKQIVDTAIKDMGPLFGEKKFIEGSGLKKAQKFVKNLMNDIPVKAAFSELYPNNTLPKRMGNLEMERILDLPVELNDVRILDSSKKLITDYIQRASNRLAQARNFGVDNKVINDFQKATAGMDYSPEAVKIIKREFGIEPKSVRSIMAERNSSKLRWFQSLTKLSTAVISNATQSVNPATSFGIGNTVRAMWDDILKKPAGREFAEDAGIAVESALRDMAADTMGSSKGLLGKAVAPFFQPVEAFNRRVSANAGKMFTLQNFEKLLNNPADKEAISNLRKMGVNVEKAIEIGKLAEDDLITAARRGVDLTQFQVRPTDLPEAFTSTWGKMVTQFKSFGYKQSEFVFKEVIEPALKRGNYKPLARYTFTGLIAGEIGADIKAKIRGKERPTDPLERAWDNIKQVGGIGIASDVISSAGYYGGLSNWVIGPTGGDVFDVLLDLGTAVNKGNFDPLMKDVTTKIPLIGPSITPKIFPTTQVQQTTTQRGSSSRSGSDYGPKKTY